MLTVDDYLRIRQADRDGMSARAIAKTFGHGRDTIRKALAQPEPTRYALAQPRPSPKLGTCHLVIDQILADDLEAPPKQRHTMTQVFRRLRDEQGYAGGYDAVRRYLRGRDDTSVQTYIPLSHDPGQRLECDFGHIAVDLPRGRTHVPVFVCTWGYSNAPFALALPTERLEALLAGMVAAFEFYGCVPREVWWDNPKTVVTHIGRGRQRQYQQRWTAPQELIHSSWESLALAVEQSGQKGRGHGEEVRSAAQPRADHRQAA